MQQKKAIRPQQFARLGEISPVIANSDMLEHAERIDSVEAPGKTAVVLQTKVYVQAFTALLRGFQLVAGDRDARD